MFKVYKFIFLIYLLCLSSECVKTPDREISFQLNPNCLKDCLKPWLVYGEGKNVNDTMHYFWSGMKAPAFVLAISDGSEVNVNWEDLQTGSERSIVLSPPPRSVFGILFQSLILFNDERDTGKLDGVTEENRLTVDLSLFEWSLVGKTPSTDSLRTTYSLEAVNFNGSVFNASRFAFSVSAFGSSGRSDDVPHLIATPNSVQLEVTLENLTLPFQEELRNRNFQYPRLALDAVITSTDFAKEVNGGKFVFGDEKSLDDEHTPGVFNIQSISSVSSLEGPSVQADSEGAFMQWRPVCYLTSERDINFSTTPHANSSLPPVDQRHLNASQGSLFSALFGSSFVEEKLNTQVTFAFGSTKDGFYTKYNYTVWTVSVGLGALPVEDFSLFAVILICVGGGVPLVMLVVGAVYLAVSKSRTRGELLLGQN